MSHLVIPTGAPMLPGGPIIGGQQDSPQHEVEPRAHHLGRLTMKFWNWRARHGGVWYHANVFWRLRELRDGPTLVTHARSIWACLWGGRPYISATGLTHLLRRLRARARVRRGIRTTKRLAVDRYIQASPFHDEPFRAAYVRAVFRQQRRDRIRERWRVLRRWATRVKEIT